MTKLTIFIYHFFKEHKWAFYAAMILSTVFFIYFGSKIEYEEDVTKLLPSTESKDNSKEVVFENMKVKDKLFLIFQPKSDTTDVYRVAESVDSFMALIQANEVASGMLDCALYNIDGDLIKNGLAGLYNHIPTFIDSTDYALLDKATTTAAIQQQMQENMMTLYSPAGSMMMDVIQQDPLAFRNIFMSKMGAVKESMGSNYKIIDKHFFSPDSTIAIAWLSPNFKTLNSKISTKLINEIDNTIKHYNEVYPDIEVYYHGAAPQSVFNSKQIKHDLVLTLSISMIIICLVFLYCYRNPLVIVQMVVPIGYGFIFALTIIYFLKGQISLLALGIGAIVLGVALSYCLHVIIHQQFVIDPVKVLKEQTVPVILGSLTTIGAFLSLLFTRAELLKDFGIFASLSLIGTTFFCLFFLPQFFSKKESKKSQKAFEILHKINTYPFERKTILIGGIILVSAICLFTSNWVKFDSNLKNISHYEERVLESQRILAEHTTKEYQQLYFATTSENLDSALVYSRDMANMFEALEELDQIGPFASHNDQLFLLQSEQQERMNRWNSYWTPAKKKQVIGDLTTAATACGFDTTLFHSFIELIQTEQTETFSLFDSEALPVSIKSNLIEYTDGKYLIFTPVLVKAENRTKVCDEITSHPHMVVIDPFYYTGDMLKLIHSDFNTTLLISSIFVFIVLLIAYKSFILAFISFLPMTISWYIVLGVMGITGIEFNLINIVISSFIYGVGVDYSIFVMDGLLADFRTRQNLLVYHKTAIIFSAFVLIVTVASLLFAQHPAVKSIGISTLIGMSSAVLIAYSLQPFLFYWLVKRQTLKGKAPVTLFNLLHGEVYFNREGEKMSLKQQIRNIYEYKGFYVEREVNKELKETHNYRMLNEYFPLTGKLLDYNCRNGQKAYWFHLNNPEMQIVGFDTEEAPLTIANNCYTKDDHVKFSNNAAVLNDTYDFVIIGKNENEPNKEQLEQCIQKAKFVLLHKEMLGKVSIPTQFTCKDEDPSYILYKA